MQVSEQLSPQQIEDIAIDLALGVVRDNMFKHGYDGARIPVDELFRTLDDFLAEFHAKNNKREKPQLWYPGRIMSSFVNLLVELFLASSMVVGILLALLLVLLLLYGLWKTLKKMAKEANPK